ncbi:MAG: 30S ribosomal protein S8 [Flavobacteriales bacterium]|jgi:small subunit ribosomal protein S8|tara:strand:+ start:22 stop:468 length:447 start_codon:yes stop_codon:yes gene_type:complete
MTSKQGYSDLITRIRNGYMAKLDKIAFVNTSRNVSLLRILRDEGFISGWSEKVPIKGELSQKIECLRISRFNEGNVFLKYVDGEAALTSIETVSKQSRRVTITVPEIETFLEQEGFSRILIISTNKGLFTHAQAVHHRLGGEILCAIK